MASHIKLDALADISNVAVVINTKTGGLDPIQIEKSVTYPIETAIFGIKGLEDVRSISKYGLSQVTAIFNDQTNIYWARSQIAERLSSVKLSKNLQTELGPITTGLGELMMYRLKLKNKDLLTTQDLIYLRTVQDYIIAPRIKQIQGIAEVDSNGGFKKEIHLNINPKKLLENGLNIDSLVAKLNTIGEDYGGGYIQNNHQQMIIRTASNINDIEAMKNIVIKINPLGKKILLKDVANIEENYLPRIGAFTHNGSESVIGVVMMQIGENSRETLQKLDLELQKINLPQDIELEKIYAKDFLINSTIKTIAKNIFEGILLVILILFIILKNARASIIAAITIPVTALISAIFIKKFEISANLMSLGAVDFGLLVDASIVIIENSMKNLNNKQNYQQRVEAVISSVRQVIKPTIIGISIIIIVYLPILAFTGIEGKTFRPMALTVIIGLISSLLVAIILVPILILFFLKNSHHQATNGNDSGNIHNNNGFLEKIYHRTLAKSLAKPHIIIISALILILTSGFILAKMPSEFIPNLFEGDLTITTIKQNDLALDDSIASQKEIENIILKMPFVERVFSRIGSAESGLDPMGVNIGDSFVILKKDQLQDFKKNEEEWFRDLENKIKAKYDKFEIVKNQPVKMRFNEILEGSRADISFKIFGEDLEVLIEKNAKIKDLIATVKGVKSVEMSEISALNKSPVLEANILYDKLAFYNLPISAVNIGLESAMNGIKIGNFYNNWLTFPVIVHLGEDIRNNIDNIKKIPIALGQMGGSVAIENLVEFKKIDKVTTIARNFAKRYAGLSLTLENNADINYVIKEASLKINNNIKLPQGYHFEWAGKFKNIKKAKDSLKIILPIILALIFVILVKTFNNLKSALIIYLAIPTSLCGGVLALLFFNIPLSISAIIGFIALFGIAILNGVVLLNYINCDLKTVKEDGNLSRDQHYQYLKESLIAICRSRLRPIIATATVATFGFLPMVFNNGVGSEVQFPLAIVVIGGIFSSTILTLFLVPTLYFITSQLKKEN